MLYSGCTCTPQIIFYMKNTLGGSFLLVLECSVSTGKGRLQQTRPTGSQQEGAGGGGRGSHSHYDVFISLNYKVKVYDYKM